MLKNMHETKRFLQYTTGNKNAAHEECAKVVTPKKTHKTDPKNKTCYNTQQVTKMSKEIAGKINLK